MDELIAELRAKIVQVLELVDVNPDDLTAQTAFFDGGLGLDSIDVLELAVMVEEDYGVKIDNKELGRQVFVTLGSLAGHIRSVRGEASLAGSRGDSSRGQ
jgi:acyl carrier protein